MTEEEYEENESTNVYRRPKAYRHLTDAQYNRCILREKFVGLALQDKRDAVRYLRSEEDRFRRAGFTDTDKQEMYRTLTMCGYGNLTTSDMRFCDSMFGLLVKSRPTPENTQVAMYQSKSYRYVPQTPLEWVRYHHDTTFENFRQWVSENKNIASRLDSDGLEELKDTIDQQIYDGHVLPFQREYTPEEDDGWLDELRASIHQREIQLKEVKS